MKENANNENIKICISHLFFVGKNKRENLLGLRMRFNKEDKMKKKNRIHMSDISPAHFHFKLQTMLCIKNFIGNLYSCHEQQKTRLSRVFNSV